MPINAFAIRSNCVSGSPVNGSPPPLLGGVVAGGGLSNVTPSTVGETDGVTVPPGAGVVVPPPGGGVVVPPPGVGLVPPLAGQALTPGLVVENAVLAGNGTTKRLGSAESALRGVA